LYHAIEVEKKIRDNTNTKFCFILPLIQHGNKENLPKCINSKNAKSLHPHRLDIIKSQPSSVTKSLLDFRDGIYDCLKEHHNNVNDISEDDVRKWCEDITIPSDEDIKEWIIENNKNLRKQEESNLPKLQKHAERN
jgi:hypothetical protein